MASNAPTHPEAARASIEDPIGALAEDLTRLPPAERAARFRLLPKDAAASVFDALDASEQRDLIDALRSREVRDLLEDMEPDDRVRLLDEMPAVVARRLLSELSDAERGLTELLLGYPEASAGRIMTPEFLELRPEDSVQDALEFLRRFGRDVEMLDVLPVRDSDRCLGGVVRLPDLVRAEPGATVADVMDPRYPAVSPYDDQEPVARLIQERDLLAVPVVDRENRLIGLVTVDDAMEVLEAEETEDLQRVAGASEPLRAPYHTVPVWRLVRTRITWLLFLVGAATLTVSVLGAFESTLEEVVTLSLFIPLLIGTGGNCGAQAATTVTRAIAVGDVRFSDLLRSVVKEARVGFTLGLVFAAVGLPVVWAIWSLELALTVSLTLLAICVWATSVGATLPLVASRVGIDPAVVSAPLVTTLVDATGLLLYFAMAQLFLL